MSDKPNPKYGIKPSLEKLKTPIKKVSQHQSGGKSQPQTRASSGSQTPQPPEKQLLPKRLDPERKAKFEKMSSIEEPKQSTSNPSKTSLTPDPIIKVTGAKPKVPKKPLDLQKPANVSTPSTSDASRGDRSQPTTSKSKTSSTSDVKDKQPSISASPTISTSTVATDGEKISIKHISAISKVSQEEQEEIDILTPSPPEFMEIDSLENIPEQEQGTENMELDSLEPVVVSDLTIPAEESEEKMDCISPEDKNENDQDIEMVELPTCKQPAAESFLFPNPGPFGHSVVEPYAQLAAGPPLQPASPEKNPEEEQSAEILGEEQREELAEEEQHEELPGEEQREELAEEEQREELPGEEQREELAEEEQFEEILEQGQHPIVMNPVYERQARDGRRFEWSSTHTELVRKNQQDYPLSGLITCENLSKILQEDLGYSEDMFVHVCNFETNRLVPQGRNYSTLLVEVVAFYIFSEENKQWADFCLRKTAKNSLMRKQALVMKLIPEGGKRYRDSNARPSTNEANALLTREKSFYQIWWPRIERRFSLKDDYFNILYFVPRYYRDPIGSDAIKSTVNFVMLEDILYDGYVESEHLGTKLDMEHMVLAVLALARLHASSYLEISQERNQEQRQNIEIEFGSLGNCLVNLDIPIIYFYLNGLKMLQKELEDRNTSPILLNKLSWVINNLKPILKTSRNLIYGPLQVMIHGEYAYHNLLFHYQDQNEHHMKDLKYPDRVKMLDFQWCQLGSPAIDLVHLLYTSAEEEVLFNHRESLIGIYHAEVRRLIIAFYCKNYDCDCNRDPCQCIPVFECKNHCPDKESCECIEKEFPRTELDNALEMAEPYGVLMGLTMRWLRPPTENMNRSYYNLSELMGGPCMDPNGPWLKLLCDDLFTIETMKRILENFQVPRVHLNWI